VAAATYLEIGGTILEAQESFRHCSHGDYSIAAFPYLFWFIDPGKPLFSVQYELIFLLRDRNRTKCELFLVEERSQRYPQEALLLQCFQGERKVTVPTISMIDKRFDKLRPIYLPCTYGQPIAPLRCLVVLSSRSFQRFPEHRRSSENSTEAPTATRLLAHRNHNEGHRPITMD